MKRKGYFNEYDFCNYLNNKCVYDLDINFIVMLEELYGCKLEKTSFVRCYKSFKTDKADIVIIINKIKKFISIKSGKNNSVHLEPINEFISFLKENSVDYEIIQIYNNYHYASDDNGNRISAKEYQQNNIIDIEKFNTRIKNDKVLLEKAIIRFLFKGTHKENNCVDGIIYGSVDNFVYFGKEKVLNYLINYNEEFSSIHFSALVLQPWTRNLNYNSKYEYRRDYVQVKWYRLEEKIKEILDD